MGRTSQRLHDRIKQHVPKSIRYATSSLKRDLPIRERKTILIQDKLILISIRLTLSFVFFAKVV